MTRRMLAPAASLALFASAFVGCGDPTGGVELAVSPQPVAGKVLLPDGKPLTEGEVTFIPADMKGRQASGKIGSDGAFTLTTRSEGDGAAEGEYGVRITSPLSKPGRKKGTKVPLVPPKYADEDLSGLKVTIKPGPNDVPAFRLDDKPPAKFVAARGKANGLVGRD